MSRHRVPFEQPLAALLLLSALACAPAPVGAQGLDFLLEITGKATRVRYPTGSLDRAARVQARFEGLAIEAGEALGTRVVVELWLLGREEWAEADLARPYGLPEAYAGGLALPAAGDAGTVTLWRTVLGGSLPGLGGVPLRGTPDEVASLGLADLLGTVEMCRRLVVGAGVSGDQPWLPELAAGTLARSVLLRLEPARQDEIDRLFRTLATLGPSATEAAAPREIDGLGPTAWLGQLGRQAVGGGLVVDREGWRAGRRVLKPFRHGRALELQAILEDQPQLAAWLAGAFGVPQPPGA